MKLQPSVIIFVFLFYSFGFLNAKTVYVSESGSGGNSGESWNDALDNLNDAIVISNSGDEIWVAAGTYRLKDRSESFLLKEGVKIYGGFSGTESSIEERDFLLNNSILHGDVANNDIEGEFLSNKGDNALHVVVASEDISKETLLDGMVISGGFTDGEFGAGNDRQGGGILLIGAPTIKNCLITKNGGYNGGGLCYASENSQNAVLSNCRFFNNEVIYRGAGVYIGAFNLEVEINDCEFESNSAFNGGGAIASLASSLTINNSEFKSNVCDTIGGGAVYLNGFIGEPVLTINECTFSDNQSKLNGGAILLTGANGACKSENSIYENNSTFIVGQGGAICIESGSLKVTNDAYLNNTALDGGAIYTAGDSLNIMGATFNGNNADANGGAIYVDESVIFTSNKNEIINNTAHKGAGFYMNSALSSINASEFKENEAFLNGGAINSNGFETLVVNCVFNKNKAEFGAGIICEGGNSLLIVNSTFVKNIALSNGAATVTYSNSGTIIVNTIVYGNSSAGESDIFDLDFNENTFPIINTCLVEGGIQGMDVIISDPDFVNFENDDFHLLPSSPAVNIGTNNFSNIPSFDFDGVERDDEPDLGAFEFPLDFPLDPSNLVATTNSSSSILVEWNDNSDNETAFVLERSIGNENNWNILNDEIEPNSVSYEDIGLPNDIYYYRLRAVRENAYSEYSNVDSALINVLTPAAPTELDTIEVSDSEVLLKWSDNSTNEDLFVLQRGSSELELVDFATIPPGTSNYIDDDVLNNTTYFYAIKARNADGDSELSNILEVRTKIGTGLEVLDVDLSIYPNPVKEFLYLDLTSLSEIFTQIEIFSLDGKNVKTLPIDNGNEFLKLNLSGLNAGNYLLMLSNKKQAIVQQILKK